MFLAWVRRWAFLAWIGLWVVVLVVAGVVLAGPALTGEYLLDRIPRFLTGDYANAVTYPYNQALGGLFGRLLTEGTTTTPWVIAPLAARAAAAVVALALVLATLPVWRRLPRDEHLGLGVALVLPLAIILPTYGHAYYAVWLLPCYAIGIGWLMGQAASGRVVALGCGLAFSFALTGFIYDYDAASFHAGPLLLLTSLPLFGILLLWGTLLAMARRQAAGVVMVPEDAVGSRWPNGRRR
jgi:hypothetical protein